MIDLISQNYFVQVAYTVYVIQSIPQIRFVVAGTRGGRGGHTSASRLPNGCMKLESNLPKWYKSVNIALYNIRGGDPSVRRRDRDTDEGRTNPRCCTIPQPGAVWKLEK